MWFAYIQAIGYIIPGFEEIFKLEEKTANIENLSRLMWIPVISYLLIDSFICVVIRVFKELKPCKEMGLLRGLVVGFKWGIIGGLIGGFILGFIECLIGVLIGGLIGGLIEGLTQEFK